MRPSLDLTAPIVTSLGARCRFPAPGAAVTCAVSGGPDSLALLVLARAAGCEVTAVHVDHGARPGSAEEAEVVAAVAAAVGARFCGEQVQVEPGPNFEARARRARYGVLPPDVLTGHTADDQAETVLLNLLRGAALDGLAGIRPDRRPLLALRRADTEELCSTLGLDPVVDPSNASPRHRRNRIRNEVVPLLDEIAARDVAPVIARQAALVRDVVDHLETEAAVLDPTDARALVAAHPAIARVAVRRWVQAETGHDHPLGSAAVQRVLDVAAGTARAADLWGGWSVHRTDSRLRLERR